MSATQGYVGWVGKELYTRMEDRNNMPVIKIPARVILLFVVFVGYCELFVISIFGL